jgi:hypothetical protein
LFQTTLQEERFFLRITTAADSGTLNSQLCQAVPLRIAMIAFATSNDDVLATMLIGAYLCLLGVRMQHQLWRLHEVFRHLAEQGKGRQVAGS